MNVWLEIKRTSDGEVRKYPHVWDWEDNADGEADYIWSEGNYACDCNRAIFFAAVSGEDDADRQCGDSAFSIRLTDDGGKVVYSDGEWDAEKDADLTSL